MTDDTQPEALEDFEVRKLAAIGAVRTSSGLVERRPIEHRRELEDQFVRGFRAAEKRLSALSAAPAWIDNRMPAIMGAAYDFRDAHLSGSKNLIRTAHESLETAVRDALAASPTPPAPAEQQASPKAAPGEPPGIQALMCVISSLHSLRDTEHFSDEEGELTNDLCTLRDWAYAQPAPATQQAPDCHHRPPRAMSAA